MKFQTITQIKKDFNLEGQEIFEIKKYLRQIQKQIHPDNNNGEFASETDKEKFILVTEALEFLENESDSTALTTKEQNTAISLFSDDITQFEEKQNQKKDIYRRDNRLEIKSSYFFPRIGSGVFFTFCGLLIAFAEQLKTHPLFSPLISWGIPNKTPVSEMSSRELIIDNSYIDDALQLRMSFLLGVILILFLYSGLLFLLTWVDEKKDEAKSEWLLSEEGLRYIVQKFAERKITDQENQEQIYFTKRDLEIEIKRFYEKTSRFRIPLQQMGKISLGFAEKTAKLYLEELANKGLIKVTETVKFDTTYEIKREILTDILDTPDNVGSYVNGSVLK